MKTAFRQQIVWASIVITILVLASLVNTSSDLRKYKKDFQNEMAQRLDLEERISQLENERQAKEAKYESLEKEALKNTDEIHSLQEALAREQKEKAALKESLEKAETQLKGSVQN